MTTIWNLKIKHLKMNNDYDLEFKKNKHLKENNDYDLEFKYNNKYLKMHNRVNNDNI